MSKKNLILVGIGVAVLALVIVVVVIAKRTDPSVLEGGPTKTDPGFTKTHAPTSVDPVGVQGLPEVPGEPVVLEVPAAPQLFASIVVDVHEPAKVVGAAKKNEWLAGVLETPLGRGFLGAWAGFFSARGDDLGGKFEGTLLDLFVNQVLERPARVLWMGSDRRRYTPVVVVPNAGDGASMAFDAMSQVAKRGVFTASGCPGAEEPKPMEIDRFVVADRAVYATKHDGALVIGRHPSAVLHGACAELFEMKAAAGTALEIGVVAERFDRGVQSLLHFAGLDGVPKIGFGVEGDRFVPRGLSATVRSPRLKVARPPAAMLAAIPEATPVFLSLALDLPKEITPDSLAAIAKGGPVTDGATRHIGFAWYPAKDEVVILWSETDDLGALRGVFESWMRIEPACEQLVLSTSPKRIEQTRKACDKKTPSLAFAAPAVKAGLEKDASVVLGVSFGRLFGGLFRAAYRDQHARKKWKGPPKEVEAAARRLEELPFFGFTGKVEGDRLAPGGFRS